MKNLIILCLALITWKLSGQTPNPADYVPMPTPVWTEPTSFTGNEDQFISFDLTTRTEKPVSVPPFDPTLVAATDEPFNPGLPDDNPESADGQDNFGNCSFIESTATYHFSTYVKLFITYKDGYQAVASGTLIGQCVVITAGHCVYDKSHGGWISGVIAVPGYSNNYRPFGDCYGTQSYSWGGWTGSSNYNDDMGMIKLNRAIGNQTGTLGYGYNTDNSFFTGNTFHNMGYPAESPFSGEKLFYCYGNYDQATTGILYYNSPNYGGNSGGATYNKTSGGNRYVYAVHSHTTNDGRSGQTRVTSSKYNDIYTLVHENCPPNFGGGIEQATSGREFAISPNPAKDKITLTLQPSNTSSSVIIYNILGREISRFSIQPGEREKNIGVAGLQEGLYFITLVSKDHRSSGSFIKIK